MGTRTALQALVPVALVLSIGAACGSVRRATADAARSDSHRDSGALDAGRDGPRPDTAPHLWLVDDVHADLSRGAPDEAGAKLLVSARGTVELTDRWDIDADGDIDLVVPVTKIGANHKTTSHVLWNSGASPWFSPGTAASLAASGGFDGAVGDFNQDGAADVALAELFDNSTYLLSSHVHLGAGPSTSAFGATVKAIPSTFGAKAVTAADLDRDGHLDLVVSNNGDGTPKSAASAIYWGSAAGFSAGAVKKLSTSCAQGNTVADLNSDGYLDVVFASYRDSKSFVATSQVYWGGKTRAAIGASAPLELPTAGACDVSAADLDADGHLDLVFSNHTTGNWVVAIDSVIYWGSAAGPTAVGGARPPTKLPTNGALGNSVADLDADGALDIVFCNHYGADSYIYWGIKASGTTTYSASDRGLLRLAKPPQDGLANQAFIADLDGNGKLDIAVAIGEDSGTHSLALFRGSGKGRDAFTATTTPARYPLKGHAQLPRTDPGSNARRAAVIGFTSRKLETASIVPDYVQLHWRASVPAGCKLDLQLRSAASRAGLEPATWVGPTGSNSHYELGDGQGQIGLGDTHDGKRYIQYRVRLHGDLGRTPVLDSISIGYN